ncbi:MAG: hypothetical protein GY829_05785 [Gammaproteobacteria bacterium]|nr:hypothetical protein [Gammaproteobacteria bacterium]
MTTLAELEKELASAEEQIKQIQRAIRAYVNNNDLNKTPRWSDSDERIDNIARNGGTGEHYKLHQFNADGHCAVCGCDKGLNETTHCCGRELSQWESIRVDRGEVDYIDGEWVEL